MITTTKPVTMPQMRTNRVDMLMVLRAVACRLKGNTATPDTNRFAAIDGLRGIAIIMVTAFHMWRIPGRQSMIFAGQDFTPWFEYGALGVGLFFVLSGFCLYYPLAKATTNGKQWGSWWHFFTRRAWRIWPAYWISLAVFVPLWASTRVYTFFWEDILTHVSFTHTLFPNTIHSLNGVLWSLGVEWHFYLAFPLLAILMRWKPGHVTVIAIFGTLAIRYFTHTLPTYHLWDFSLLGHLSDFVIGMYVAHRITRGKQLTGELYTVYATIGIAGLLVYPFFFIATTQNSHAWYETINGLFWGTICLAALAPGVIQKALSFSPLVFVGTISYSLYLYNYLVIYIQPWVPEYATRGSLPWWAMTALAVFLLAVLGYYVVEYPFMRLREWVSARSAVRSIAKTPASPGCADQVESAPRPLPE